MKKNFLYGFWIFMGLCACVPVQSETPPDTPPFPDSIYDACGIVLSKKAVGSGFWVGERAFVTCLHVLAGAGEKMVIRTVDGGSYRPMAVQSYSAKDDLVILTTDPANKSYLGLET